MRQQALVQLADLPPAWTKAVGRSVILDAEAVMAVASSHSEDRLLLDALQLSGPVVDGKIELPVPVASITGALERLRDGAVAASIDDQDLQAKLAIEGCEVLLAALPHGD